MIDLYLSVKIRKNQEIDTYDDQKLTIERTQLIDDNVNSLDLVEYIQTSIEILMKMKKE